MTTIDAVTLADGSKIAIPRQDLYRRQAALRIAAHRAQASVHELDAQLALLDSDEGAARRVGFFAGVARFYHDLADNLADEIERRIP